MNSDKISNHIFERANLWNNPNPRMNTIYKPSSERQKRTEIVHDDEKIYNHITDKKFYSLYDTIDSTAPIDYSGVNSRRIIKNNNKLNNKSS